MGLVSVSKETQRRGKIRSCSYLEGLKEIHVIQATIQVLPTALYGEHILIFVADRHPHSVRGNRTEETVFGEREE